MYREREPSVAMRLERMLAGAEAHGSTTPLAESIFADDGQSGALVGATLGPYRLVEYRGEGGFGEVYIAEQTVPIRRRVAIKVLRHASERTVRRFELEVWTLSLMEHPAIARIFDAGVAVVRRGDDESGSSTVPGSSVERCFIAMEAVDGVPISEYAEATRLGSVARLELFALVIDGVVHAHQKGVVHRDLKPANVIVAEVDGRPSPKIIDFGIAKAVDDAAALLAISAGSDAAGTPRYMSPEQALGARAAAVDSRADIYSLGIMLRELLSDDAALGNAGVSTGSASISHRATTPRWMRADLDAIVLKAVAIRPDDRYATAVEFAADIRRVVAIEPVSARRDDAGYRWRRWVRRRRLPALVVTVAAIGLLVSIGGVLRGAMLARAEAGRADRINGFLREMLTSVHADRRGASVEFTTVIDDAVRLVSERFADYPLAEADVRSILAEVNGNLGRVAQAVEHAERAEAIRREMLGAGHESSIDAGLALAGAYLRALDKTRLEGMLDPLERQIRQMNGPREGRLAQVKVFKARVLFLSGEVGAALTMVREARESMEREGIQDPSLLALFIREELHYLRRLVVREEPDPLGVPIDPEKTLALSRRLHEAEVVAHGADALQAWSAEVLVFKAAHAAGRPTEALRLAEDFLVRVDGRLSATHGLAIDARRIAANSSWRLGDFRNARVQFERQTELIRSVSQPSALELVSAEAELPLFQLGDGDFDAAETTARTTVQRFEALGGNFAKMAYLPMLFRARALSKLGRMDEATELFGRLISDSAGWDWPSDRARLHAFHAAHLASLGRHAEASAAVAESLAQIPDPLVGTYRSMPGDRLPVFAEVAELAGDQVQLAAYRAAIAALREEARAR